MSFSFDWDPLKALANRKKHKASFDEASTVFDDPLAWTWYDEAHSSAEDRHLIIGHSLRDRLLIVSFRINERRVIRIISARLATRKESREYEAGEGFGAGRG